MPVFNLLRPDIKANDANLASLAASRAAHPDATVAVWFNEPRFDPYFESLVAKLLSLRCRNFWMPGIDDALQLQQFLYSRCVEAPICVATGPDDFPPDTYFDEAEISSAVKDFYGATIDYVPDLFGIQPLLRTPDQVAIWAKRRPEAEHGPYLAIAPAQDSKTGFNISEAVAILEDTPATFRNAARFVLTGPVEEHSAKELCAALVEAQLPAARVCGPASKSLKLVDPGEVWFKA